MANALNVKIGGDIRGLEKALNQATSKMQDVGRKMQDVGKSLTQSVTLPILAIGAGSVKAAADFEQSFADIRKTVNATESEFSQMEEEIRNMAKSIPTSVNELNRLAGVAGQLGVEQKNIIEFTRTIAMLGDTTDIAGEQAALSLSRFMNIMGTAQSDIERVGSTIVGLGNNFAAMESEIVDIATSMAAFGNQMGLSESQVLAFSAAIAASGGQVEAASTAFQKTAATMQQAVIEGNKHLKTFAEVAGVSADEFSSAFKDNAAGALQLFLRGLQRIGNEGKSTASVLDDLGLADQRLQREFGKLIGNLDQLDQALIQSETEWEKNTALTEEAQKRYKTFSSQMSILKNNLLDLGITIGNDLIPAVRTASNIIKSIISGFQELSPVVRKSIIGISGVAAAIGPLSLATGTLLIHLPKITKGFKALTATMLKNPYIAVGAAILTIGINAINTRQNIRSLREEFEDLLSSEIRADQLDEVNKSIEGTKERIEDINQTVLSSRTGLVKPGQQKELDELNTRLAELEKRRKDVRMAILAKQIGEMAPNVQYAVDVTDLWNASMNSATGFTDQWADAQKIANEYLKETRDLLPALSSNTGNMSGSIAAMRDELTMLQGAQNQVNLTTDAGKAAYSEIGIMITNLQNKINQLTGANEEAVEGMNSLQAIGSLVGQRLGEAFAQALVFSDSLGESIKNIGKQLLSRGIINFIAAFASGGIGGIFAGGALKGISKLIGVNDALITSAGDVVQFNSADDILASKNMDKVIGGGGSGRVEVFGTLKGQDLFISSDRGSKTYSR